MDLEALKNKLNNLKNPESGGGDSNFINLKDGKNPVRILPYQSEREGFFFVETATHQINENGQTKYVHCPRGVRGSINKDAKCPICEAYFSLWKLSENQGEGKDGPIRTIARSLKPRARYFANVLDREDDKVKVLSYGSKLQEKFLEYITDEEVGDFTDYESGRDWDIIKKMVDKYPNYDSSKPKMATSEVSEDVQKVCEEKMFRLEDYVKYEDAEEMQRLADINLTKAAQHMPGNDDESEDSDEEDSGVDFQEHLDKLKS